MIEKTNFTTTTKIARTIIVAGTVFILVGLWSCLDTGKSHSKTYLISHFNDNQAAFYRLRDYADAVDPDQNVKQLQFYIREEHEIFSIEVNGREEGGGAKNLDSWIPTDSLVNATKWTKRDFDTVYSQLNELKGSGIKRGEPFTLILSNNGSDELYHIYKKPIATALFLDNPCSYYILNDYVVLEHIYVTEWGGTDCFTDEPHYSKDILVSHFNDNSTAFFAVRDYAIGVDPELNINQLDFNIDKNRGIFSIKVNGKEEKAGFESLESWRPTDSLLNTTNWTKEDFIHVYTKLNALKCTGIKIGEPFSIVFNNSSGCRDLYHLYRYPVEKDKFLRAPSDYYIANDQVILEHIKGWGYEYCYYK